MKRHRVRPRHSGGTAKTRRITIVTVLILCALSATVLAIIIGLIIGDGNVPSEVGVSIPKRPENTYSDVVAYTPGRVSGYLEVRSVAADLSPYAATCEQNGYDTVSFNLKNPDGKLTFYSEAAHEFLPPETLEADEINLLAATENIHRIGMNACGLFYCDSYFESGALRAAYEGLESAVVKEAELYGVDEVVLMNLPSGAQSDEDILRFVRGITVAADAKITVAVPYLALGGEGTDEYITRLARCCDGIAIDFSGCDTETFEKAFNTGDGMRTQMAYYADRYNARFLLSAELAGYMSALSDAGYTNIGLVGLPQET